MEGCIARQLDRTSLFYEASLVIRYPLLKNIVGECLLMLVVRQVFKSWYLLLSLLSILNLCGNQGIRFGASSELTIGSAR